MSDLREKLNAVLDSIKDEPVRILVAEVFEGTKTAKVWHTFECRGCRQQQRLEADVEVPAARFSERVKALQMLLDQAKGRPAEHKTITVTKTVRHLHELEAMTDAQLAAIDTGEVVVELEEGEWSEMPALPPAVS